MTKQTSIVIAGIGQTAVGEHWATSLRELAHYAIEAAIEDSGGLHPQALFAANMLAPTLSHQAQVGALVADFCGMSGIEALTIEAAGASGGAAIRQAMLAVQSGTIDTALVVGVEKFTDVVDSGTETAVATAMDSDYESIHGMTAAAQAALLMRRYFHEYNVPADGLAGFPLLAHANGAKNPNAMFRRAIKKEIYDRAGMVSEPLNIFDAAPNADGAAALLLTRREILPPNFSHPLVALDASAAATDAFALHDREDILAFDAARRSVERALSEAGISREEINIFEYHDAFSIYAALSLEAAEFAARGQGWRMALDGDLALDGSLPCATMGGLKARGYPGGATGVYQAVEAALQLRGEAGENQVEGASAALIQSLGGPATTAVTHVLTRQDAA